MGVLLQRIKDWWENADKTQRMVSLFGAGFLVLIVGVTLFFAGKPKMQPVVTGVTDAEKGMVQEELMKQGFAVEVSPQGEILIPTKDYHSARMALATANKMPKGSSKGIGMLDSINTFTTTRQEAEKIKAAKEGELEQSIMTIQGVQSALVHINFGKDAPTLDEKQEPTAVVNIVEGSSGDLTQAEGKAIARLVQNSVSGMTPSGVSVITNSGKILYDGQSLNSTEALAANKMDAEVREGRRRTLDLQNQLDLAFGPGNTIVDVQVALNMDKTRVSKNQTERTGDAVIEESAKESLNGKGSTPNGVAGVESNTPGALVSGLAGSSGANQNYDSEVRSKKYPTSTTQTDIDKAAGELIGMNVSVTANKESIKDLGALSQIVDGYVGDRLGTEGFTATVTPVEFNTEVADASKKAAAESASAARMQQIISLLPVAALIAVGLMLVKAIGKGLKGSSVPAALAGGGTMSLPNGSVPMANAQPMRQAMVPGMTGTTGDRELDETLQALGYTNLDDPEIDIESIRQKIDIPLEQIKKLAKQKPETVSMLIKSWMLEDHRR